MIRVLVVLLLLHLQFAPCIDRPPVRPGENPAAAAKPGRTKSNRGDGVQRPCFTWALLKSVGHDGPLLHPGPLCGGEAGATGRVAGIGMDADAFSPAHGCAVEKPDPGSRTCRAGCPASAKRGGLLFWLLFSWPRKRKVTRSPKAIDRSCL